jgi:hypothetical protein
MAGSSWPRTPYRDELIPDRKQARNDLSEYDFSE